MARDLGMSSDRLDAFAEGRIELAPETVQALVRTMWNGHVEFDVEHDALRSAIKQEPRPLGVHPAPFEPTPLSFQTGRRRRPAIEARTARSTLE
jgi:hypothetical protein